MTVEDRSSTNPVPNFYRASAVDFKKIPGSPIAYWVNKKFYESFFDKNIGSISNFTGSQNITASNDKYVRFWFELSYSLILKKWVPYAKGGEYRKYYGNNWWCVNWSKSARDFYSKNSTSNLLDKDYWFKSGITYTDITTKGFNARFLPEGFVYDKAGPAFHPLHNVYELLSYVNTKPVYYALNVLNPTYHCQVRDIKVIPIPNELTNLKNTDSNKLVDLSKSDWDSYETSWDFTTLPLLSPSYHSPSLQQTYTNLRAHWRSMTLEMQRLEEENNRIFIEAYGLQDELTPDVPLSEITLTCNPYYRYNGNKTGEELEALLLTDTIKELISYAVGCMFGRYSLDTPGLVLANQGEKLADYLEQVQSPAFMPDSDNIIPVLDDEYFEDDIVGRFKEFLTLTFGEDSLSENLDFIAQALGGNGKKSSEGVIRDYFLKSFYKDHVKMYKKRPIYWLFSSGKGRAFNALIYMHRYNNETLALMRTDYLLELEGKLDARAEMIKSDIGKEAQEKVRLGKMIGEIMEYDEVLKNRADEYIDIDLDDGVKVNYEKFKGLVEKI